MSFNINAYSSDEKFLREWREYSVGFDKSGLAAAPYLEEDYIREAAGYARFYDAEVAELLAAAVAIRGDKDLCQLFAFCVYHLNQSPPDAMYDFWPDFGAQLGERKNCFYMLVSLTLIPDMRHKYRASGVPEEIIHDTALEFSGFYRNHVIGYHTPGIITQQMAWLKNYRDRRLFRLGRMEFRAEKFANYGIVLRQRSSGAKVMLAGDGLRYDEHGLAVDPVADPAKTVFWTASLTQTPETITGHLIHPEGRAEKTTTVLSFSEWEIVLQPGDDIIDMHIPPGGGLSLEACFDSMSRAADFFPAFMPERHFKSFFCYSWIFNTQLEEKLPESNLAKFMREPYIFPVVSTRFAGAFFVFSRTEISDATLSTLPRDTSLQRAVLEILESGQDLRNGGMFYCLEDLKHFGSQYYRCNFPLLK